MLAHKIPTLSWLGVCQFGVLCVVNLSAAQIPTSPAVAETIEVRAVSSIIPSISTSLWVSCPTLESDAAPSGLSHSPCWLSAITPSSDILAPGPPIPESAPSSDASMNTAPPLASPVVTIIVQVSKLANETSPTSWSWSMTGKYASNTTVIGVPLSTAVGAITSLLTTNVSATITSTIPTPEENTQTKDGFSQSTSSATSDAVGRSDSVSLGSGIAFGLALFAVFQVCLDC